MSYIKIYPNEYKNIVDRYINDHLRIKDIAEIYNVKPQRIGYILKKMGVTTNYSQAQSQPNINKNFFEKIDTEEKAYFLGFIYADGHINTTNGKLQINLHEKDKEILEKFRLLLNLTLPLNFIKGGIFQKSYKNQNKQYIRGNQYRLSVLNKKLTQDLVNIGLTNKKSFSIKFPDISENLQSHFIRGFFDGDGSIYQREDKTFGFSIGAPSIFNESIRSFFKKYNVDISISIKKCYTQPFSYIHARGNPKVLKIMNILYENATIFLERKHNKFNELKIIKLRKRKYNHPKIQLPLHV